LPKKLNRQKVNKILAKLGTGALAPLFCEAKAITSDEFCKKSHIN
jgi:hypothetical protein